MKRNLRSLWPSDDNGKLLLLVPLLLIVIAASSFWGNHLLRRLSLDSPEYLLDPTQIALNSPPQWITASDIRTDVIRSASLDQPLSILDDKLTQRIALAFASHPWVAKVVKVEKFYPARVEVEIEFRQPVATVNIHGRFLPIDRNAVQLPPDDFSAIELSTFPLIININSHPSSDPGMLWSDARVQGGALIAAAFGSSWKQLGLDRIVPSVRPVAGRRDVYTFDLFTQSGTRIPWGRQYLDGDASERSAAQKRDLLMDYVKSYGKLDGFTFRDPKSTVTRTAESPKSDSPPKK